MKHGSLFSGIGGFDLAAEWMGWENVFHCEWNEFGQKVLKYYWPKAESFSDITKTDFTKYANQIDVLSGGFPCQPYSTAGKRLGKEDERHLWPEMRRAIREIKPRWVVGENVRGLISWNGGLVFEEVQAELETEGYEVQSFLLPAAGVGSCPHRRDRIWFIAHSIDDRHRNYGKSNRKEDGISQKHREELCARMPDGANSGIDTNTSSNGHPERREKARGAQRSGKQRRMQQPEGMGGKRDAADASSSGLQANDIMREPERANLSTRIHGQDVQNTNSLGQKWGMHEGKPENANGKQFGKSDARNNGPTSWENFPTQSPLCYGDDGLSNRLDGITFSKWRNESIKAGGNAVVPNLVVQIFRAIEQYESNAK